MTPSNTTWEDAVAYAAGELDAARSAEVLDGLSPALGKTVRRLRLAIETLRSDDSPAPTEDRLTRYRDVYRTEHAVDPAWSLGGLLEQVAALLFDSRQEPAVAGMRGVGPAQLVFEAGDATLELAVEPAGDTFEVTGQVTAPHQPDVVVFAAVKDGVCHEVTLNDRGVFTTTLVSGTYDLRLLFVDRMVTVPALRIE